MTGDTFTRETTQQIFQAVRDVQALKYGRAVFPAATAARVPAYHLGIVMETGPGGEPDFGDNRYWVEFAAFTNDDGDRLAAATIESLDKEGYSYFATVATNIGEAQAGTHSITPGTSVVLRYRYDRSEPAVVRWWFNQIAPSTHFAVVRDVPDPDDIYVIIQRVKQDVMNPRGNWLPVGDPRPVLCYPLTVAAIYEELVTPGEIAYPYQVRMVEVIDGNEYVMPWVPFDWQAIRAANRIRMAGCNPFYGAE